MFGLSVAALVSSLALFQPWLCAVLVCLCAFASGRALARACVFAPGRAYPLFNFRLLLHVVYYVLVDVIEITDVLKNVHGLSHM